MKYNITSIAQQHQLLALPAPEHPLISLVSFEDIKAMLDGVTGTFTTHFYTIAIKKDCKCKVRYGQGHYDFDAGVMSFIGPRQLVHWDVNDALPTAGWMLVIHPDFVRNVKMQKYGFFSYCKNEALHLSPKEEKMLENIMKDIRKEYRSNLDDYSQDVILSHLELLLNYSNRFYNRQFITRKTVNNDLLTKLDNLLSAYISSDKIREMGVPTVKYISEQLNMSTNYLGDMLKKMTGQSTQQHIHNKLIDKAKEILATSSLSVSEIAYDLGFEYPQSFSKFFKQKTNTSPLEFRNSFN